MILRPYRPSDLRELAELFYDTVHTVNAGDYTAEQLDAWADGAPDLEEWGRTLFPAAQNACYSAENAVAPQAETE